jgi:hypothetical protein
MTTPAPLPRIRVPCCPCRRGVLVFAYSANYPTADRCAVCRADLSAASVPERWQGRSAT